MVKNRLNDTLTDELGEVIYNNMGRAICEDLRWELKNFRTKRRYRMTAFYVLQFLRKRNLLKKQ